MTRRFVILGRPVSSTNSQQIIKAGKRRMVIKSKGQVAWRKAAHVQLLAQRGKHPAIAEPCAVSMWVYRAASTGDTDNFAKGVLDALQAARILDDDKHVSELHVYRTLDRANPRIVVTVETGVAA